MSRSTNPGVAATLLALSSTTLPDGFLKVRGSAGEGRVKKLLLVKR